MDIYDGYWKEDVKNLMAWLLSVCNKIIKSLII